MSSSKGDFLPSLSGKQNPAARASLFFSLILGIGFSGCGDQSGAENPKVASEGERNPKGEILSVDSEGRAWRRGPDLETQWPDDPRVDIARELMASGNFPNAELVLTTVLKANPNVYRAQFLRGIAKQKQIRYEEALLDLDAALKSGQAFPESRHGEHFRGWCLYHLGRTQDAKEAFMKHIEKFPEEGDSHFGVAVAAIEEGNLEDAQPYLERSIELQKDIPSRRRELSKAYARLGDVHLGFNRLELAHKSYQTAVVRWPDHYEAWAKLARVLDRMDLPVKAERARNEQQKAMIRVGRSVDEESPD